MKKPGWSSNKTLINKNKISENEQTNPNPNAKTTQQSHLELNEVTNAPSAAPPPPTLTQVDMVEPPSVNLVYVRDTSKTSSTTSHHQNPNMITHYLISAKPVV